MLNNWIKKSFLLSLGVILISPQFASAYAESSIIQDMLKDVSIVQIIKPNWETGGNFVLHKDRLSKLYSLRGYQAIWIDSNGQPNEMTNKFIEIVSTADRHGLNPAEYWDNEMIRGYEGTKKNPAAWITFELMMTETLIRYVSHLSGGRIDPEQIDTDIKYKKKDFNEFADLNGAVSYGPQSMAVALELFAPTHPRYKDLMDVLVKLKSVKSQGGWVTLTSPGFILKKGVNNPIIGQLRDRLNQLGYTVSNAGGNLFDQEMDDVVRRYQTLNGLTPDGIIGVRSEVLRNLNYTVAQRISQVEATMEKLRWLPKNIETRHIFVNLATTEFRLFDDSGRVFYFKTINGQPFRRTPSMRDAITFVNLNPYWTVPRSIAIKDKLPMLKQDPNYLQKHNMLLIDEQTDQVVDSTYIDWRSMTPRNFTYYIRQLPGPDNALGVVKFPLQNPWSIYMHDTNEKPLFGENKRHRSSGCVRLEYPLELAAYLLQDQPGWTIDDIKAYVPVDGSTYIPGEVDKKVYLKKSMPVYFTYLTVEKAEDGAMRFLDDVYGQDLRVIKAVQNKKAVGELF